MPDSPTPIDFSPPPPRPTSRRRDLRSSLALGAAFILALVAIAAALGAARVWYARNHAPQDALRAPGDRQPSELSMATLGGATWTLSQHRGHVVLLNYFATWCPPCMAETPDLVKIAHDYAAKGVDFAAISLDADAPGQPRTKPLVAFQSQYHVPYPILLPGPNAVLFGNQTQVGIPQTYLIDRDGRTARVVVGEINPKDIRHSLDQLLAEKPTPAPLHVTVATATRLKP